MQNQLTHLWAYEDPEERRLLRATLAEHPEWQRCLGIIRPPIRSMENKIMYPTSFSPIGQLLLAPGSDPSAFTWTSA